MKASPFEFQRNALSKFLGYGGMLMKRVFKAVIFGGNKLFWDYKLNNTSHYKGYYHKAVRHLCRLRRIFKGVSEM